MADPKKETFSPQEAYVTWRTDKERATALTEYSKALPHFGIFKSAKANRYNDLSNLAPGVHGRPEYNFSHYEWFRPSDANPKTYRETLEKANLAYYNCGIIRNIIDLMGDFACQGIRIVHPNRQVERFHQKWWQMVEGPDRSERFLNNLYRQANVIVRKMTYKLSSKFEDSMMRAIAEPDSDPPVEHDISRREIPKKYVFLEPTTISVVGGALSSFSGEKRYAITVPSSIAQMIKSPKPEERALVAQLPPEIRRAALDNKPYLLPEDKTRVFHYKKDDWQTWAVPIVASIFKDVAYYEKCRLADLSALDGAISNIRIFKLGNLEYKIAPTRAGAARLADMLQNNNGTGTLDLIWGPDIELIESNTKVHEFLKEEKYKTPLNAIYVCFGIPPTLSANSGASGTTNNFISVKTLLERLQYGRSVLMNFWTQELADIQKAMGFRYPASIEFDYMNLANEDSMLMLYLQLADRNLISDEALHHMFKQNFNMERVRMVREGKMRESKRLPLKASALPDPSMENSLKKIALQSGVAAPSEVGLELDKKKPSEVRAIDVKSMSKTPPVGKKKKKKGVSGQGRPKNKKDSTKRKTKKFTPRGRAMMETWAKTAQTTIAELVNPILLEHFGRKNLRSFTDEETIQAEGIKFSVLYNCEPLTDITLETVQAALVAEFPEKAKKISDIWTQELASMLKRQPTFDEIRQLHCSLYTYYQEKISNGDI